LLSIAMQKIIKLNRRHINQLAQIDAECKHQMEPRIKIGECKKRLKERFDKCHEIFFGFKEGGELKGYVTLKPLFPGHRHCELYWLAVKAKYQGQGIGSRLIRFIEGYAKRQGFRRVCLYTNKIMKRTRSFYEKNGYRKINEFPGYYGYKRHNTAVLYGKEI